MTRGRRYLVAGTALAALSVLACLLAPATATAAVSPPAQSVTMVSGAQQAGPLPAAIHDPSPSATITTCIPREIIYSGILRFDADLFAHQPGSNCITVHKNTLTIDKCIKGNGAGGGPGSVTTYDKIYIGQNYTSGDPLSGLPVKMTRAQKYTLNVKFTGHAACKVNNWIDDLDIMFSNSIATATIHPTAELVIAGRWDHAGMTTGRLISVDHHWYREESWLTCTPGICGISDPHWPLIRLTATTQFDARQIRLAKDMYHLREMHLVAPSMVLDMAAAGTEVWAGGKGLKTTLVQS